MTEDEHDDDTTGAAMSRALPDPDLTAAELSLLGDVGDLLSDPAVWALPSDGLEESVVAAIAGARGTTGWQAPAVAPATAGNVRSIGSARSRWLTVIGAAVAGAAAAALITTAVVHRNDDSGSASEAPAPTTVLDAAPGSAGGSSALVDLAGTAAAPGLAGTADLTVQASGVRIQLSFPGLPRRDGGDFYQVWLKNCDGTKLVPAGSFHELDNATAWAGVPFNDYPIITVTKESAVAGDDPAQASSGEIVATGEIGTC